jgi:hypothetical protein
MKKSLVIFIVVFLVLALATFAFAAKPDIFDKGTGLDISPTFSYTSTVDTGDKGTGLDISPASSYTSTVDKGDKVTGLDKKQEKDFDKSNGVFSNSSYDSGYKRTNYTTSVTLDSTYSIWDGKWILNYIVPSGFTRKDQFAGLELFAEGKKVTGVFYYFDYAGKWYPQGTLSLRVSKDGTLSGKWVLDNRTSYDSDQSGFIKISYLDLVTHEELKGYIGYKKNALDYRFEYEKINP